MAPALSVGERRDAFQESCFALELSQRHQPRSCIASGPGFGVFTGPDQPKKNKSQVLRGVPAGRWHTAAM